ncbi:FUSC family protein [Rhodococcus fascians]|nr:FUSC family protein [Rhodococcus fascians]MBY4237865.1 FUSC family protein [Rhodococcus fascians]MBY4253384.1 FUSC family protein [Rhodococcus fascians]MBY4269021.1 FUSC family protein [Rhodococcus fascians]MBY4275074.1 FUSC family protein [Rhodococcus fascians]
MSGLEQMSAWAFARIRTIFVLGSGSPIWYRFAFSIVAAAGPPLYILASIDRLDLALYTMAGSMQALFGHDRTYRSRAHLHAVLTVGQFAAVLVSLLLSASGYSTGLLIVCGAIVVSLQKLFCDAAETGPPAQAVLSFITLGIMFGPTTAPADIPRDLALYTGAAVFAAAVCLAPQLWRPVGPETDAVQAAEAACDFGDERRAVPALNSAWNLLASSGSRSPALLTLVARLRLAEARFAGFDSGALSPVQLWAELNLRRIQQGDHPLLHHLRPGSPLWSSAGLCLAGTLVSGLAALAVGVDRPHWAIIAACAIYRGNFSTVRQRAVFRSVGTLGGVLLYAAIAPLASLNSFWLVTLTLLTAFGIEVFVSRNYAVGNVFIAPMALLMTTFADPQSTGDVIDARLADTMIGALIGVTAALIFTGHRSGNELAVQLSRLRCCTEAAESALADKAARADLIALRHRLGTSLVDTEAAASSAAGDRLPPDVSGQEVDAALRRGRAALMRTLAFPA